MGLLRWLFRRRPAAIDDWVWRSEEEKFCGLAVAAGQSLATGEHVVVLAHFPDTLVRAGAALHDAGLQVDTRASLDPAELARWLRGRPAADQVRAMLVRALPATTTAPDHPDPAADAAPPLTVLVAEMHVLPAAHQRVVDWARTLPARARVHRCVALDEPVLQLFVSPAVQQMMARMGLRDGERIRSAMVTRGLLRAANKLSRRVTGDGPAESAEQWLQRYYRA